MYKLLQRLANLSTGLTQTILIVMVVGVFINTLSNKFVYDDHFLIEGNLYISDWEYFNTIFTKSFEYDTAIGNNATSIQYYRPFLRLLLGLAYQAFGFQPAYWHGLSILFFSIVVVLVYQLCYQLSQRREVAALGGLIFALHPLHSQTVAWVNGMVDSMQTGFFLGAFLVYLRFNEKRPNDKGYILLLGAFILSLSAVLSKEASLTLFVLVASHQFMTVAGSWPKRIYQSFLASLPFVLSAISYFLIRQFAYGNKLIFTSLLPFKTTILTIPSVVVEYLRMFIWPVGLSLVHPVMLVDTFTSSRFWLSLGLLVLLGLLVYFSHSLLLRVATVWVLVTILPVLNLGIFASLFDQSRIVQDRYLFLPSIGLALIAALGIINLYQYLSGQSQSLQLALVAVVVVSLGGLGYLTIEQNRFWYSDFTLWQRAAQINPSNDWAQCNYGNSLQGADKPTEAIANYLKILELKQGECYCANVALGHIYFNQDPAKALTFYQQAVTLAENKKTNKTDYKNTANILMKMAQLYSQMGNSQAAKQILQKTIVMYPDYKPAQYVLATIDKATSPQSP